MSEFKGKTDDEIKDILEDRCIARCGESTDNQKLRSFDEDMAYYRKCLRDKCRMGRSSGMPSQKDVNRE